MGKKEKSEVENELVLELTADLKRTRADFENYRKQMDIRSKQTANFAKLETVRKILPLIDDMSRAIMATPELKPLEKTLEKTLKDLGLAKIEAGPGTVFDPDFHDAVMMNEGNGGQEIVEEVLRDGYLYEGEIIRPAMVKVTTK